MTTWTEVAAMIEKTQAKNVQVRDGALYGNDGTILSKNPKIAAGYVQTDWDAINCRQTRNGA
jgi:hypothetical protein